MSSSAEFLALLRTRSTHTLGEYYADSADPPGLALLPGVHAASPGAIAALLSAPMLHEALTQSTTLSFPADFPLPARNPRFEAQLDALWYHASANFPADRATPQWRAVLGSFDRICAELYRLTLDELMTFTIK